MTTGISATALTSTKLFVTKRYGSKKWDEVLGLMKEATQNQYKRHLTPKTWIDYDQVVDMLKAMKKTFGDDEPKILIELGKHNSEENLRVTQRIIMKILSVEWVLKMAARLWKGRVRDGGILIIQRKGKKHGMGILDKFPDPQPEWLEYLIGWFTRTIELSGGRNVKVELVKAGSKPFDSSEYELQWS